LKSLILKWGYLCSATASHLLRRHYYCSLPYSPILCSSLESLVGYANKKVKASKQSTLSPKVDFTSIWIPFCCFGHVCMYLYVHEYPSNGIITYKMANAEEHQSCMCPRSVVVSSKWEPVCDVPCILYFCRAMANDRNCSRT
jgi:hypothetical protein